MNKTLNYYNSNAQEFIDRTFEAKVSDARERFIAQLPAGAHILDVGCGSGRDSLYFLERGLKVTAFDASEEIAKLAAQKINHPVHVLKIEELQSQPWSGSFDGVWAMASLLHLPKHALASAIRDCVATLKLDSPTILFFSFKSGKGESYDERERFFSYYEPQELEAIFKSTELFESVELGSQSDTLGRVDTTWLNVWARPTLKPSLVVSNTSTIETEVPRISIQKKHR